MTDKFKPGEVVIVLGASGTREGTVTRGPAMLPYATRLTTAHAVGYYVDGHDCADCKHSKGVHFYWPHQLRKKRPPEETTTWDKCVWRPKRLEA